MAFKIADAYVSISQRGMKGVSSAMSRLGKQTYSLGSMFSSAAGSLALLGAGAGVAGLASLSAQAEQTAVAFEVMLGSGEAATEMIQKLTDFSASTPFSLPGLQEAAKTLLNFSVPAGEVMDDINMISNIAAGNENKMKSIALVFGQIASTGRLMGQDLLQLINAGFNPLQLISQRTGESMAELKKRMEDGNIGFSEVRQAFADATSEGGKFYQMNEKQSQTVAGLWSTLKDNILLSLRDIMDGAFVAFDLKGALANAIEGVKVFRDYLGFFFDNVGTLAALGVEHVKLFADNSVEQVKTWATNAVELASWFADNWRDIFADIGNATMAVFSNLGHNVTAAFKNTQSELSALYLRAQAFLTGTSDSMLQQQLDELRSMQGQPMEFKGLLDGFESQIKELPKLTQAEIKDTNPTIEALKDQLKIRPEVDAQSALDQLPSGQVQDSTKSALGDSAKRQQSQVMDAASLVSSIQQGALSKQEQLQKTANGILGGIQQALTQDGIKIQNTGPATAG